MSYKWYWMGDGGWVQFGAKQSADLEKGYLAKAKSVNLDKERFVDLSLSWAEICKNFTNLTDKTMVGIQRRFDDYNKRRAVKREKDDTQFFDGLEFAFLAQLQGVTMKAKDKDVLNNVKTYGGKVVTSLSKSVNYLVVTGTSPPDACAETMTAESLKIPIVYASFITKCILESKKVDHTSSIVPVKAAKKKVDDEEEEEEEEGAKKKKKTTKKKKGEDEEMEEGEGEGEEKPKKKGKGKKKDEEEEEEEKPKKKSSKKKDEEEEEEEKPKKKTSKKKDEEEEEEEKPKKKATKKKNEEDEEEEEKPKKKGKADKKRKADSEEEEEEEPKKKVKVDSDTKASNGSSTTTATTSKWNKVKEMVKKAGKKGDNKEEDKKEEKKDEKPLVKQTSALSLTTSGSSLNGLVTLQPGTEWLGVCTDPEAKDHFPFLLQILKIEHSSFEGFIFWKTLNDAQTKIRGKFAPNGNGGDLDIDIEEYEAVKGEDELELPMTYSGVLSGKSISGRVGDKKSKSTFKVDLIKTVPFKVHVPTTWKGTCKTDMPFVLNIDTRNDDELTGTIEWQTTPITVTKWKGSVSGLNMTIEEQEVVKGDEEFLLRTWKLAVTQDETLSVKTADNETFTLPLN